MILIRLKIQIEFQKVVTLWNCYQIYFSEFKKLFNHAMHFDKGSQCSNLIKGA